MGLDGIGWDWIEFRLAESSQFLFEQFPHPCFHHIDVCRRDANHACDCLWTMPFNRVEAEDLIVAAGDLGFDGFERFTSQMPLPFFVPNVFEYSLTRSIRFVSRFHRIFFALSKSLPDLESRAGKQPRL